MKRHTKGPWKISEDHPVRRVIKSGEDKPRSLVVIEHWTREEDARLMAASPELLNACKVALKNKNISEKTRQVLIEAIKKAEGENNGHD